MKVTPFQLKVHKINPFNTSNFRGLNRLSSLDEVRLENVHSYKVTSETKNTIRHKRDVGEDNDEEESANKRVVVRKSKRTGSEGDHEVLTDRKRPRVVTKVRKLERKINEEGIIEGNIEEQRDDSDTEEIKADDVVVDEMSQEEEHDSEKQNKTNQTTNLRRFVVKKLKRVIPSLATSQNTKPRVVTKVRKIERKINSEEKILEENPEEQRDDSDTKEVETGDVVVDEMNQEEEEEEEEEEHGSEKQNKTNHTTNVRRFVVKKLKRIIPSLAISQNTKPRVVTKIRKLSQIESESVSVTKNSQTITPVTYRGEYQTKMVIMQESSSSSSQTTHEEPSFTLTPTPTKTTVLEYQTQITTTTKLRTYTYVVTKRDDNHDYVTSTTEVKPQVKTVTLTSTVTRTIDVDSTPASKIVLVNLSSRCNNRTDYGTDLREDDDDSEGRGYLATRVMSNGVEVIVAGDKTTIPGEPDVKRILPSTIYKPVTLAPSTLTDHMMLLSPQDPFNAAKLSSSLYPNQFVTKTCMTTFTYLTTYVNNGTTTISSNEQVISNIATEERVAAHTHFMPAVSSGITLTQNPNLATGVFHTTYTYLNTMHDGDQPLVVTSKHTVANTITAPDDYLSLLQPSERATPVRDTNTYINTVSLTKTLIEDDHSHIVSTLDTVTQVVITESIPPKATSVMTSYIALDFDDQSGALKEYSTTDVVKTYFVTYTYYNTLIDKGSTKVHTNVSTSSDIVTEKLFFQAKKTASNVIVTKPIEQKTDNLEIFATKTYVTTFTYFTTVVDNKPENPKANSTTVNSRTRIIENVVMETIDREQLPKEYLKALRASVKSLRNSVVDVATIGGQAIEITAVLPEFKTIDPTLKHQNQKYHEPEPSTPSVISGSTIIFFDDDDQVESSTKMSTPTPPLKTVHNKIADLDHEHKTKRPSKTKNNKPTKTVQKNKVKTDHGHNPNIQSIILTSEPENYTTSVVSSKTILRDATLLPGDEVIVVYNKNGTKKLIPIADKKPTKTQPKPTKTNQMSNLLQLSSMGINSLSALRPVFSAIGGLLQTNMNRRNDSVFYTDKFEKDKGVRTTTSKTPRPTSKPPQTPPTKIPVPLKVPPAVDVQNRSPIYIPVSDLNDDLEYAASQNIGHSLNNPFAFEKLTHLSQKNAGSVGGSSSVSVSTHTPLINGGIPISPGEVITANSDVIVGRPGLVGPRIPFLKNNDYTNHPVGMKPPPLPSGKFNGLDGQVHSQVHPIPTINAYNDVEASGSSYNDEDKQSGMNYVGPPPPIEDHHGDFSNDRQYGLKGESSIKHHYVDKTPHGYKGPNLNGNGHVNGVQEEVSLSPPPLQLEQPQQHQHDHHQLQHQQDHHQLQHQQDHHQHQQHQHEQHHQQQQHELHHQQHQHEQHHQQHQHELQKQQYQNQQLQQQHKHQQQLQQHHKHQQQQQQQQQQGQYPPAISYQHVHYDGVSPPFKFELEHNENGQKKNHQYPQQLQHQQQIEQQLKIQENQQQKLKHHQQQQQHREQLQKQHEHHKHQQHQKQLYQQNQNQQQQYQQNIHHSHHQNSKHPPLVLETGPDAVLFPEVIGKDQPLLVDIRPSQVANVIIPHGSSTALIFGGSAEPHKNGQYFDDPSPYPDETIKTGASIKDIRVRPSGNVISVDPDTASQGINLNVPPLKFGYEKEGSRESNGKGAKGSKTEVINVNEHSHDVSIHVPPISFGTINDDTMKDPYVPPRPLEPFKQHVVQHGGAHGIKFKPPALSFGVSPNFRNATNDIYFHNNEQFGMKVNMNPNVNNANFNVSPKPLSGTNFHYSSGTVQDVPVSNKIKAPGIVGIGPGPIRHVIPLQNGHIGSGITYGSGKRPQKHKLKPVPTYHPYPNYKPVEAHKPVQIPIPIPIPISDDHDDGNVNSIKDHEDGVVEESNERPLRPGQVPIEILYAQNTSRVTTTRPNFVYGSQFDKEKNHDQKKYQSFNASTLTEYQGGNVYTNKINTNHGQLGQYGQYGPNYNVNGQYGQANIIKLPGPYREPDVQSYHTIQSISHGLRPNIDQNNFGNKIQNNLNYHPTSLPVDSNDFGSNSQSQTEEPYKTYTTTTTTKPATNVSVVLPQPRPSNPIASILKKEKTKQTDQPKPATTTTTTTTTTAPVYVPEPPKISKPVVVAPIDDDEEKDASDSSDIFVTKESTNPHNYGSLTPNKLNLGPVFDIPTKRPDGTHITVNKVNHNRKPIVKKPDYKPVYQFDSVKVPRPSEEMRPPPVTDMGIMVPSDHMRPPAPSPVTSDYKLHNNEIVVGMSPPPRVVSDGNGQVNSGSPVGSAPATPYNPYNQYMEASTYRPKRPIPTVKPTNKPLIPTYATYSTPRPFENAPYTTGNPFTIYKTSTTAKQPLSTYSTPKPFEVQSPTSSKTRTPVDTTQKTTTTTPGATTRPSRNPGIITKLSSKYAMKQTPRPTTVTRKPLTWPKPFDGTLTTKIRPIYRQNASLVVKPIVKPMNTSERANKTTIIGTEMRIPIAEIYTTFQGKKKPSNSTSRENTSGDVVTGTIKQDRENEKEQVIEPTSATVATGTHHAGNEVKISDDPRYQHAGSVITPSTIRTPHPFTKNHDDNVEDTHEEGTVQDNSKILPTKVVTHTQTLTVTTTTTTIIKSAGKSPSTQTLLFTETLTSTLVDTITETKVHTLIQPTSIVSTVTTTVNPTAVMVDVVDTYATQYPSFPVQGSVQGSTQLGVPADVSEDEENLDDYIITDTDPPIPIHEGHIPPEDESIFVVMTDQNTKNVVNIHKEVHEQIGRPLNDVDIETVESIDDPSQGSKPGSNHETIRDEMLDQNDIDQLMIGGVLIASPPRLDSSGVRIAGVHYDECVPECKASRNELCQRISGLMRCVCRPGFARMFPDRPCKPTYTYRMRVVLAKNGKDNLRFNDSLHDETSRPYATLAAAAHDGLDRMVMQSDLRDVYHGVHVEGFEPSISGEGVVNRFYVQLSDNADESHLTDVFKRYLRHHNYSLGGTEVYAAREFVDALEANDFNECLSPQFHDCSEHAECFNLRGTYTCSCKDGFADLSENPLYPGRICSAELIGCEKCSYHGTCYSRGDEQTLCECFQWYAGERCQINLKILLMGLVVFGVILIVLLIICSILTCMRGSRRRPQGPPHMVKTSRGTPVAFMPHRASLDRRAMIQDTSSETSHSEITIPYVVQKSRKQSHPKQQTRAQKSSHDKHVAHMSVAEMEQGNTDTMGEQKDRSLTVMIPRAKYHPAAPTSPMLMHRYEKRRSSAGSSEAKLLCYLDAGPSPSKERRASRKCSNTPSEPKMGCRKVSAGALVSAGFEVSATVGGTEVDKSENATITADLLSSNQSQFATLRKSSRDDDSIDQMSTWLNTTQRVMTVSEARSYDETTIQPQTKSLRSNGGSQNHNHDEIMAERDIGSTFLLPHTHLYKPDRGSDISGFDSN